MRIPGNLHSGSLGFNMTPMIDVVFLLIIFFLVSSHLAKQEVQLPLPLPTAESGIESFDEEVPRLTINVLSDGTLMLSGRRIVHTELATRLADRLDEEQAGLEVRIRSDRSAAVQVRGTDHAGVCASRYLGRIVFRVSSGGRPLMRRPSPYIDRRGELEIKMTPMIDVVFLLLVFFVWTASFQIVEHVLPSHLREVAGSLPANPDDPPPPDEDFDRVVLRVRWVGDRPVWRINETDVGSLSQVRSRLETIANIKRDAPVILHPDRDVPLGHVIDLYDLTRLIGLEQIQFAASESI